MPHCIFCKREVPHSIAPPPGDGSICLECLVAFHRFQMEHSHEIVESTLPDRVKDAIRRIRSMDPAQLSDPAKQEQLKQDLQTVQQVVPL